MLSSSAICSHVFAVCVAFAVLGSVSSVPTQDDAPSVSAGPGFGLGSVLWTVLDDCFDESAEPVALCLKSKALTALDRALSKPAVAIADGVTLAARAGKSLADPQTERADRAALDAAKDTGHKSALLDDMLVSRMDKLVSTRTIVLDGLTGQEGRGKKKDKAMQQAMMMAGMMIAAVMGPMAVKMVALLAGKALVLSKIALVLSAIMTVKKMMQPQQGGHESESASSWGRSMHTDDAHDMAFSGQKQ